MNAGNPISRTLLTVRYNECDPSGIAFNANFLTWADIACFDSLAVLGPYEELNVRGFEIVAAESNVRFRSPCLPGDDLEITGWLDRLGTTSMVIRFEMRRGDDVVAEVTNRYVWVSAQTGTPLTPPDDIRAALEPYAPVG